MARQRELAEEGRAYAERVHRRADVVYEPREGQRLAARAAAWYVGAFADQHALAGAGKHDGRGEPVRARADDDRVVVGHRSSRSSADKPLFRTRRSRPNFLSKFA